MSPKLITPPGENAYIEYGETETFDPDLHPDYRYVQDNHPELDMALIYMTCRFGRHSALYEARPPRSLMQKELIKVNKALYGLSTGTLMRLESELGRLAFQKIKVSVEEDRAVSGYDILNWVIASVETTIQSADTQKLGARSKLSSRASFLADYIIKQLKLPRPYRDRGKNAEWKRLEGAEVAKTILTKLRMIEANVGIENIAEGLVREHKKALAKARVRQKPA